MAGPRVFPSRAVEDELFARLEAQRARRQAARAQVSLELSERASAIRDQAQWIPAEVAVAMARSGIGPGTPEFDKLSNAAAKSKSKRGLGWHSLGAVVKAGAAAAGAVGRAGDWALGNIDEEVAPVLRAGVRGAALGAQSLYEEAQGVVRNVASYDPGGIPVGAAVAGGVTVAALAASAPVSLSGAAVAGIAAGGAALGAAAGSQVEGNARWEPQSAGAIALGRRLAGEKVELGGGWLPNTMAGEDEENPDSTFTIGEEQRQRARRVTIGGSALTPGRLLAAGVVEPGSKPHDFLSGLVDGSLALSRFDPASAGLKAAGNANRNRKLFVEAGGILSTRPTISPEKAQAWWSGATDLRRTLVELVDTDPDTPGQAFYEIWKATKGKLGADVTHRLAKATTEAEVDEIIKPMLGVDNALRGPLEAKFGTYRPFENVRLAKTMPGHTIDLHDADQSVVTVERWLQNAKAPQKLIAEHTAAMAAAQTRVGRYEAVKAAMTATRDLLVEKGWDKEMAESLTKMVGEATDDTRGYWVNAAAENVNVRGMWGDEPIEGPKPHAYAEFVNRALPLPDVRDVRAATSMFAGILQKNAAWTARDVGGSTLDFVQGQIWKRAALLRGAYTFRVIGEEQFRMAASGLDSLVNHPLSLISMRISEDSLLGRGIEKLGGTVGRAQGDMVGGDFRYKDEAEFAEGMDEINRALNREMHLNGWADPRRPLPIWKKVAPGQQDFRRAWAGELGKLSNDPIHREVARNLGDLDGVKEWFWGAGAGRLDEAATAGERYRLVMGEEAGGLLSREVADRYIDSVVDRIRYTTGNDAGLIDMLATGRLGDAPIRNGVKPSKELQDYLAANEGIAPAQIYAQVSLMERGAMHYYDQATKWLFSNLMAERTNNLSRSPSFRQFYWQRSEELAPFMNAASQAKLVEAARANKLDDVADRIAKVKKTGDVTLEQADMVAKGFGLDRTRDLLYDMTERGQLFDAARIIFPFGEAWKEMGTRWGRIAVEQPQALRRGQQIVNGAREAGFFYENANGEEVFAYPGSGWVSEKLFGVPVPLTGRVAGLSLMTEVLPGVGPVAQVAAGAFLPDKPEWDWARDVIFPFGETDVQGGVVESFLPAWVQKWRQAGLTPFGQDEGQWNATVLDVARYLASTGQYDTSTPEGVSKMLDAAKGKARLVYALRGAAQFFAPTAPTPEWIVADKNGDALVAQVLVKEYQAFLEEDFRTATDRMLERYGDGVFLLLQGKTAEVTPAAPVTKEGADWERSNAGLVKRFPNVYGFFAPSGGDLDLTVYGRQLDAGRRERLTPEQAVRLANDRVANAIYQKAKSGVGPNPPSGVQAGLRALRKALAAKYPGYGDRSGIPEKVTTDQLIADLQTAAADERLTDSPATKPLQQYLEARQLASKAAVARGLSETGFRSSKEMAPMRAGLRALGNALVTKYPEFGPMFERVFDRELAEEEEVTANG